MKKTIIFLALLILPSMVLADFDVKFWKFYKDISISNDGLVRFNLDDEIFANTKRDLADLRIVSSNGFETPYKLLVGKSRSRVTTSRPKMLNNSYVAGEKSTVILDFGLNHSPINRLEINTNSENFQRNVVVFGSDDLENWNTIKENIYIYDYTDRRGGVKSQNTEIKFANSIFRYLKIDILDSAGEPVKINSVTGTSYETEKVKESESSTEFTISQNKDDNSTEIYVDRGYSGVPFGKLKIDASGKNFNRGVAIQASFNNETWRSVDSGYIFRYNTAKFKGENLQLNFPEVDERYLRIIVRNYDNQPINVTGIKTYSIYREIVFEASAGETYKVYYGNSKARFPRYDLEKYFQYLDYDEAVVADLTGQISNPDKFVPAPPEPEVKGLTKSVMPIVLIFASFILLILVFNFLKH